MFSVTSNLKDTFEEWDDIGLLFIDSESDGFDHLACSPKKWDDHNRNGAEVDNVTSAVVFGWGQKFSIGSPYKTCVTDCLMLHLPQTNTEIPECRTDFGGPAKNSLCLDGIGGCNKKKMPPQDELFCNETMKKAFYRNKRISDKKHVRKVTFILINTNKTCYKYITWLLFFVKILQTFLNSKKFKPNYGWCRTSSTWGFCNKVCNDVTKARAINQMTNFKKSKQLFKIEIGAFRSSR